MIFAIKFSNPIMRSSLVIILIFAFTIACSNKENTMNVSGQVEGLKKGILYLQRINDTLLTTIDSVVIDGKNDFSFSLELESPEVFYLFLNKNDGNDINDRITFFGEVGDIIINTRRDAFESRAEISGSKSHEKFSEYKAMISNFNAQNLEYAQADFQARRDSSATKIDSIEKLINKNIVGRYLYTLNFALTNKDSHVAPYLALSEVFDARIKYLDTINNSLTPEVANSKYGLALQAYIEKIKRETPNEDQ